MPSSGAPKVSSTLVVPPGSMSRFVRIPLPQAVGLKLVIRIVLPIKKFLLSEDQVSHPIPTLSDRQFVVTKSNLSLVQEKNQRDLFWYREELFKIIRGRWLEASISSLNFWTQLTRFVV